MSEANTSVRDTLLLFPFLADQPADVVDELSKDARYIKYKLGDSLARLNQPPQYLFFLIQGSVR